MFKKYFIFVLFLFSFSMKATIYYVDASMADNTGNGLSWATAKKNIQAALALVTTGTDEVWVKAGTHLPVYGFGTADSRDVCFYVSVNVKLYGGFNGTETSLNQRNIVNNPTILDGNGGYHTMIITNSGTSTAIIDGFTIQGGNANGTGSVTIGTLTAERNFGGGVLCISNSPTFNNMIFKSNAANFGGGVFNNGGSPKFNGCVFTNNTATQFGGGIENFNNSTPAFTNCVISNNSSSQKGSGAANNGGSPTYINCTIVKNNLSNGVFYDLNNTTTNYKNCIVWGNATTDFVSEAGSTASISYSVTQGSYTGTLNLNSDPLLVNINDGDGADDKWFTADDGFKISSSSNCYNSGDNSLIPSGITVDILNTPRISASTVDRGAYELVTATVTQSQENTTNGLNNGSATVNVTGATGTITYNWLPCGTGSTNTISNLAAGNYYCAVMDGTALLQVANFTILPSTSTRIYVNVANTNTTQNGNNWNTAYSSFQTALNDVMSNSAKKEIWVAKGTYLPTTNIHNQTSSDPRDKSFYLEGTQDVKIYGGFNGNETTLSQRDFKNNKTVLSGNFSNSTDANTWGYHVFSIKNANKLLINGLIISEGNSNGTGAIYGISRGTGGALVHENASQISTASTAPFTEFNSLLITNCKGTSIPSILSTKGNLKLLNSIVENCITNTANSNIIKLGGAYDNFTEVTNFVMSNCSVVNGATNAIGAILFDRVANPTLAFSTIANNDFGVNGNDVVVTGENFAGSVFTGLAPRITTALFNSNIFHNNINSGGILKVALGSTSPVINYLNNVYTNSNTAGFCVGCSGNAASGTLNSDPLFVSLTTPKGSDNTWFTNDDGYRLSSTSPVMGTGFSTPNSDLGWFILPANDISGANRVISSNPEPGAYEYDSTSTLGTVQNPNTSFSIKLYPNPATTEINLNLEDNQKIEIYSMDGKLVKSVNAKKGDNKIDVSKLTIGNYIIKTKNKNIKFIKK